MIVHLTESISLPHRAFCYSIGRQNFAFCASAMREHISYVDSFRNVKTINGSWGRIHATAIYEPEQLLGILHNGFLSVVSLKGDTVFEKKSHSHNFGDLLFDPMLDELWLSKNLGDGQIEVEVLDIKSWRQTQQISFTDPFHDSDTTFHPSFHAGQMGLQLTTGGCGDSFYILDRNDGLTLSAPAKSEIHYPVFSPYQRELLATEGNTEVVRFNYPDLEHQRETKNLLEQFYRESKQQNAEFCLGNSIAFLDEDHALVAGDEEILAILDIRKMSIVDYVQVSPRIEPDSIVAASEDWTNFFRVADQICFPIESNITQNWKTHLFLAPVSSFWK